MGSLGPANACDVQEDNIYDVIARHDVIFEAVYLGAEPYREHRSLLEWAQLSHYEPPAFEHPDQYLRCRRTYRVVSTWKGEVSGVVESLSANFFNIPEDCYQAREIGDRFLVLAFRDDNEQIIGDSSPGISTYMCDPMSYLWPEDYRVVLSKTYPWSDAAERYALDSGTTAR